MEKISRSPRCVIDITGTYPLSLGGGGGGVNSEKLENEVFLAYEGVIGS